MGLSKQGQKGVEIQNIIGPCSGRLDLKTSLAIREVTTVMGSTHSTHRALSKCPNGQSTHGYMQLSLQTSISFNLYCIQSDQGSAGKHSSIKVPHPIAQLAQQRLVLVFGLKCRLHKRGQEEQCQMQTHKKRKGPKHVISTVDNIILENED